jgi:hypothetical protein
MALNESENTLCKRQSKRRFTKNVCGGVGPKQSETAVGVGRFEWKFKTNKMSAKKERDPFNKKGSVSSVIAEGIKIDPNCKFERRNRFEFDKKIRF